MNTTASTTASPVTIVHDMNRGPEAAAEIADPVARLLYMLAHFTLEPTFEQYGNFVHPTDRDPSITHVWGNFADYSFCFNIDTSDAELVARLTAAIRANQATPAYAEAKRAEEARRKYWRDREEQRAIESRRWARQQLEAMARGR